MWTLKMNIRSFFKAIFYITMGIIMIIPLIVALYWVSKQPTS